jgi:hypothetical protein
MLRYRWRVALLAALISTAVSRRMLSKTTTDKIFFIGPNKTGTSSITALFRDLGYKACHHVCYRGPEAKQPNSWWSASREKNLSYFQKHDVFADNGNLADVVWLAEQFPTARFVLNMRPLKSWLLSRMDMHRKRIGCKPDVAYAPDHDCGSRGTPGNNGAAVLKWIIHAAAAQEVALALFRSSPALRNRFVAHDFVSSAPGQAADTKAMIDWITRPNLDQSTTDKLVLSAADLPARGDAPRIIFPHKFRVHGKHLESSERLVTRVLEENGCSQSMHDDALFVRCASAVTKGRQGLRSAYSKALERLRGGMPLPNASAISRRSLRVR